MAKDKVDISIPASINVIKYDINKWNVRRGNIETSNKVYNRNIRQNNYWITRGKYYIRYINDSRFAGRLIISCNINDMLHYSHSGKRNKEIELHSIKNKLEAELGDVIDFNLLSDISDWGISRE